MQFTFSNIAKSIIEIITAFMIMLFVYTGVSKLITQEIFYKQVSRAPVIGQYAHWIIWIIPISELLIAALLVFKITRLAGYYAFAFLMVLFTLYIAAILLSGSPLPCSCGGIIQQLTWQQHLVFNGCFIVLNIAAILLHYKTVKI